MPLPSFTSKAKSINVQGIGNDEKKKTYTSIHLPPSSTKCADVGTEPKVAHVRVDARIVRCSLLVGTVIALLLGLIIVQLQFKLYATNLNVAVLQHKISWMVETCDQINRNMLEVRLSLDKLKKNSHPDSQLETTKASDTDIDSALDSSAPRIAIGHVKESDTKHGTYNSTSDFYMTTNNSGNSVHEKAGSSDNPEIEADGRGGRAKRSNRRGKQSRNKSANKRRAHQRKRTNKRGPVATHFKGGLPETFIRDGGLIAPWFPDNSTGNFALAAYQFREGQGAVEVTENGLYLIYAQIYYLTSDSLNSFTINVETNGQPSTPIAFCSASAYIAPGGGVSEASCYTSVARYLNATNKVSVKQRERNRRMILRDGYSFLGMIRLNSQQPTAKGRSRT